MPLTWTHAQSLLQNWSVAELNWYCSGQHCTRTVSAAVLAHQNCRWRLSGKHVPTCGCPCLIVNLVVIWADGQGSNCKWKRTGTPSAEGARIEGAEHRGAENRGAEGADGGGVWGGVSPSPPGEGYGEGAVPPPQNFFLILDHEIAFLVHSGRYILQFSCLLYAVLR